jgi:NADPH:quinone reductase-like Zn-dependent oxidoreductase
MTKMRAMIVPEARGRFRMQESDLPEPGGHEVRIRVHACGVCHSDSSPSPSHRGAVQPPFSVGVTWLQNRNRDVCGPDIRTGDAVETERTLDELMRTPVAVFDKSQTAAATRKNERLNEH